MEEEDFNDCWDDFFDSIDGNDDDDDDDKLPDLSGYEVGLTGNQIDYITDGNNWHWT